MEKLRQGQAITPSEVKLIEALEILKKEIRKKPEDRVHWLKENREEGVTMEEEDSDEEYQEVEEEVSTRGGEKEFAARTTMVNKEIDYSYQQQEDMNKEFVYSRLRTEIKDDFRRVGFALHDGSYYPVIQLSPFDVCMSLFRSEWMRSFKEFSIRKKNMRLVFWYGQSRAEEGREISLVDEDNLVSYYEGCTKMQQKEVAERVESTGMGDYLKEGMEEAEKDLKLPTEQRLQWFIDKEILKRNILATIPSGIRNDFRRVGFARTSDYGRFLPVILLSPFDICGSVREQFLSHIEKVSWCSCYYRKYCTYF